jgi:glycosyltransferase involved in cell wall biosynthesis/predicted metal-dependent phosphoesterase TrpH
MIDVELQSQRPSDDPRVSGPMDGSGKPESLTRMDMHCHSWASSAPVNAAIGFLDMPECYSPPEKVYDQAIARGMDLVTITDHDTIAGALELAERGFENFVVGEEVTVFFPEDHCKLHITVWDLTPELHQAISSNDLRNDVYAFADWLVEHNLPHAFAHPLYVQNGRLTPWHLERAALLFKGWELLNGAHSGAHRRVVERYLNALTPAKVQELSRRHDLKPRWSRVWHKAHTAGSDDHGLLNIGRTWTGVVGDHGQTIRDPREFLKRVMAGRSVVGGVGGHPSLLAHQLATVASNWVGQRANESESARGRYIASKLVRFAGVDIAKPSKIALAIEEGKRRLFFRKKKSLPVVRALRETLEPVLEKYPDLRANLDPETWTTGAPIAQHERMAQFADDLCTALSASMAGGTVRSIRERDKLGIVDHLMSYLIVHVAQLPYLFSLFHQNKERNMLEKLEHEAAPAGSGVSVLERSMRISLFTDTLGDVNGVCRFIQNVAHQANVTGRDLQVITSTSFQTPKWDNIFNFKPVFATKMPKYEQLEMVLPPLMKILRHVDAHQPDVIHISTPGPVGLIGFLAAKMLRVPVLGVYHTDFPAYIDRLFDDHGFTRMTEWYMRFFYEPFRSIFTRSQDYVESLVDLGMPRERMVALMPGLETSKFNATFRDPSVWQKLEAEGVKGVGRQSVKVLYVGRVSVEKNMPMLLNIWKQVHKRCKEQNINADLVIVGDGPYRKTMEAELKGKDARFLGFRHGRELSTIYASSDLFVFPSTTDTLGQVVMESQSSGLPVMVTDQGGPKEVVTHGETGYVLPHEEPRAWVDHLFGLIADDAKRKAMGAAAEAAMEPFDIAHSFEHFWQVHTEAWHEHLATLGITPKGAEPRHLSATNGSPAPGASADRSTASGQPNDQAEGASIG